jgi:hypothetical protein
MKTIRKYAGVIWILLGPTALFFLLQAVAGLVAAANAKIANAPDDAAKLLALSAKNNLLLQWGIMIAIFLPIVFGLVLFGKYALKGEYDKS